MVITDRVKHGIHFYKVWYANEPVKNSGIIQYHQAMFESKGSTRFDTLLSDLRESEDTIKSHFSKNCRYEVNRGDRENIEVNCYSSEAISDEMIDDFIAFFTEFWKSKGVDYGEAESLRRDLREYRDYRALSITQASHDGEVIVYHTHIVDGDVVRLLHSASLFRLDDEEGNSRYISGIANRYLHFQEMCHFKQQGITTYDWGGAGQGEDVQSITKFKASFGGTPATYYDSEVVSGTKAKLFRMLVRLVRG